MAHCPKLIRGNSWPLWILLWAGSLPWAGILPCTGILFSGCPLLPMDPVKVVKCRPSGKALSPLTGKSFTLIFSRGMNRKTVRKAFLCRQRCGTSWKEVSGNFSWHRNNTRLVFSPHPPLPDPVSGVITLSDSAEDRWGNDLDAPFKASFSSRPEETAPILFAVSPPSGTALSDFTRPLAFRFSEPIQPAAFIRAWTLSPQPPGHFLWKEGNRVAEWHPQEKWTPQTYYRWKLSREVLDEAGNPLAQGKEGIFRAGTESVPPEISEITLQGPGLPEKPLSFQPSGFTGSPLPVTDGLPPEGTLTVTFSEPIDPDTAQQALSLSPPADWTMDSSQLPTLGILTAVFTDPLPWDTLCRLTAGEGITDLQGNPIRSSSAALFRTNHAHYRPPLITRAVWKRDPSQDDPSGLEEMTPWDPMDMTAYAEGEERGFIDLYIDLNPAAGGIRTGEFLDSLKLTAPAGTLRHSLRGFAYPPAPSILAPAPEEDTIIRVFWEWEWLAPGMLTLETTSPWGDQEGISQDTPWIITCPTEGTP